MSCFLTLRHRHLGLVPAQAHNLGLNKSFLRRATKLPTLPVNQQPEKPLEMTRLQVAHAVLVLEENTFSGG